jgi:outer membrane murein-binding lipoprotein Lpp
MTSLTPVNTMLDAVKAQPFSANSLFKNPAESQLSDLDSFKSFIELTAMSDTTGQFRPLATDLSKTLGDFSSSAASTLAAKTASLQFDLPIMSAASSQRERVDQINTELTGQAPDASATMPPCFDLKSAFAPLTETASMITKFLGDIKDKIAGAMGVVFASFDEMMTNLSSMGADALAGIQSVIGDLKSAVDQLVDDFNTMVEAAANAVSDAINQIKAFNFLGLLGTNDPCMKAVIDSVVNPSKIDATVLGKL